MEGKESGENSGNADQPSGNWCLGPSTRGTSAEAWGITPGKFLRLYMQNPATYSVLGQKMVRSAVRNAFLHALIMRSPSPRNDPLCSGGFKGGAPPLLAQNFLSRRFPCKRHIVRCVHLR